MAAEYLYTFQIDGFSFGGRDFAAQSLTFEVPWNGATNEVYLAGMQFNGISLAVETANPHSASVMGSDCYNGVLPSEGYELCGISTPLNDGPHALFDVTFRQPNWDIAVTQVPGTVTITRADVPEPPTVWLTLTGIALAYLVARYRRRWDSRSRSS